MNVPPTSTPIRAPCCPSSSPCDRVARHEISNRGARAYNGTDRRVKEHLADIEPLGRASVEQRAAQALRELIVAGPAAGGDAARAARPRRAARHLADADPPRARRARARGPRRGRRAPAARSSAGSRREDLEELYAARLGLEGLAARLGAAAVGAGRARADARACSRARPARARRRTSTRYLVGRWDVPLDRVPRLRPHAPRRRGRAALLARRALQPARALDAASASTRSVGTTTRFYEACDGARRRRAPSG